MGDRETARKDPVLTTRTWHTADVALGIYALRKDPTKLNLLRLGFDLIGLYGYIVFAKVDRGRSK